MKKIALVTCIVLVASLVTGCSSSAQPCIKPIGKVITKQVAKTIVEHLDRKAENNGEDDQRPIRNTAIKTTKFVLNRIIDAQLPAY